MLLLLADLWPPASVTFLLPRRRRRTRKWNLEWCRVSGLVGNICIKRKILNQISIAITLIPPLVIPPNVFANEGDIWEAVGEVDFLGTVISIHLYALFIQPVLASYASSGGLPDTADKV
jgi:hypothetical protein